LKIPDDPKMARAALSRWAIDWPCAVMYTGPAGRRLFAIWRLGGPLMAHTDPRYTGHLEGPNMDRFQREGLMGL